MATFGCHGDPPEYVAVVAYPEDVELIFVFDESRKLSRIDLFPVYTGP
jgi:hypothetical protein